MIQPDSVAHSDCESMQNDHVGAVPVSALQQCRPDEDGGGGGAPPVASFFVQDDRAPPARAPSSAFLSAFQSSSASSSAFQSSSAYSPASPPAPCFNPDTSELLAHVDGTMMKDGPLYKVGQSHQRQLETRTGSSTHYDPEYFDSAGKIVLAVGIHGKAHASALETAAIVHAKHVLKVGSNVEEKESNMDNLHSHADPGAVHAVPVVKRTGCQQQFGDGHESYYKERQNYGEDDVDENGRKKHKKTQKTRCQQKIQTQTQVPQCYTAPAVAAAIVSPPRFSKQRQTHSLCTACHASSDGTPPAYGVRVPRGSWQGQGW